MKPRSLHPLITPTIHELARRYPMVDHALIKGLLVQQFSLEQMHLIGERFYHVIKNFPRFLAAMISHWDNTTARMPLVENLFEEHGRMDPKCVHVETYVDFLKQMGMDHERITTSKPTPATTSYFNSVMHLCTHHHHNQGLGALAYIEDIVHQVSGIFGSAVKKERAHLEHVSHFADHEILDDQHSQEIYDMLDMTTPEACEHAVFGMTMGAFFHHQLYETILAEVLYETGDDTTSWVTSTTQRAPQKSYPLQTGDIGKKRLDILNALYNEQSLAFIERHAPHASSRVLEIGCGAGTLSYTLATRKPEFTVIAIDSARAQIEVAQASFRASNLQFATTCIEDLVVSGKKFDVVYLRWVLIYQKDVMTIIEHLAALLAQNGRLIIEDNEPGHSGCFSPTHQHAVDKWHNFWTRAVTVIGQGPGFSSSLLAAAQQSGLTVRDIGINQQLLQTDEEKALFMLGVWESKDAILAAGVPQTVFDEIYHNAASISDSPVAVGFVRNFQFCFNN